MTHIYRLLVTFTFILVFPLSALASGNDYTIGAGDKIQIIVYGEEELTIEELYIDSSGEFDYPYLGQLMAIGKTTEQLKAEIIRGLKGDYLVSPKVRVGIVGFRSIFVNGEIKKPGGYEYQPGLTVDKAIALAGGFTERAARKSIYITREDKNVPKNRVSLSHMVAPGDIIVIEQSFF
ncbi:polysaccharide biosynthesis/export family protein [Grimontia marina]|uniref:Polysaccharide biosynthesis/export protein n=1 Tax=Grimontia marina TaxID=646534 RepID=A0A128ESE8_9GAMM|nr:polysaccharide biosynthesis/export family protein [Grimontia marina]CZF77497.1 Polysaccharide biosynthesis/export protein [Grimontia marina]